MVEHLAVASVADADLERGHAVEHVELGERDAPNAADLHRLAHQHGVEPAAAPGTAGHGAELAPALAKRAADLVVELGRERPAAHPRGVGLGDAEHVADGPRPDPGARRRLACERVGGGDERIGPVVDVEHRPLRALEEDALALLPGAVEPVPDRRGEGQQAGREREQGVLQLGGVRIGNPEAAPERVVMQQQLAEPGPERFDIAQVAEAYGAAADLVLVGRADAAAGGAEPGAAACLLPRLVELAVDRQDQADVLGDRQRLRAHADALRGHGVDLAQ